MAPASNTLNAGDRINGGGGSNTLILEGSNGGPFPSPTFNLNTPAQLTGIQTIDAAGLTDQTTTIDLRNGLDNVTVNVGSPTARSSSFVVDGGNDNDVIDLLGNGGNFTVSNTDAAFVYGGSSSETVNVDAPSDSGYYSVVETAATIGATINGNNYNSTNPFVPGVVLQFTGGGKAIMGSNITGLKTVLVDSPDSDFVANAISGLVVEDGTIEGGNILQAGGPNQILFGTANDTFIASPMSPTTIAVNSYTDIIDGRIVVENFGTPGDVFDVDLSRVVSDASVSDKQTAPSYGTLTFSGSRPYGFGGEPFTGHIALDGRFYAPGFSTSLVDGPGGEEQVTYTAPTTINPDGSFDYVYSNIDDEPYSSYEDIYNAAYTLLAGAYNDTNGAGSLTLDAKAITIDNGGTLAGDGASIYLYQDGNLLGTTVASTSTAEWYFTPADLQDGVHTIVAEEENAPGDVVGSTSPTFTPKTSPTEGAISDSAVTAGTNGNDCINAAHLDGGETTLTGTAQAGEAIVVTNVRQIALSASFVRPDRGARAIGLRRCADHDVTGARRGPRRPPPCPLRRPTRNLGRRVETALANRGKYQRF